MSRQITKLDFQRWNKWRESLEHIGISLQNLDGSRRIHSEFLDILKTNKKLHRYSRHPFFAWIFRNYSVSFMVKIRRLVDERSNSLNLYRLLSKISENTQQVTVDNYVRSFFPHDRNFSKKRLSQHRKEFYYGDANKTFKEAFGNPRKTLMSRDVEKDKQIVKQVAKDIIEDFVSSHVVHFDKYTDKDKEKAQAITANLAHKCLDDLIKIYNKYSLLLRVKKLSLCKQTLVSLWDEPFLLAWKE